MQKQGFISIDEAIALIDKDTRTNAVVDADFLLRSLPYLRVNGNYNIKLLKNDGKKIVSNGSVFVQIATEWDRSRLEHAIVEHYKRATGREVDPNTIGLRNLTTARDDKKNPSGRLIVDDKPMTNYGDSTEGGYREVNE